MIENYIVLEGVALTLYKGCKGVVVDVDINNTKCDS